jgi:hypothetical protein
MSGVAGRSGRKKFVPTPYHRDMVKLLASRGILQEEIRQLICNPQTGKPLSIKTLERAFATEIRIAKSELDFKVGTFIVNSILGRTPVHVKPRKDDRECVRWAIFYAKTRMGWKVTPANRREHSPIDWEEAEQKLDNKIARILRGRKSGETGGSSEAEREKTR